MDKRDTSHESIVDLGRTLKMFAVGVDGMASGYQLIFNRVGSMGRWAITFHSMIGALIVLPLFLAFDPMTETGARIAIVTWQGTVALMLIHGVVNKRPWNKHHAREVGSPWGGRIGGILLPAVAGLLCLPHCPGLARFIAFGFAADRIQSAMIRARFKRQALHMAAARKEAEFLMQYMDER